jgi:cytochrome c oxidase assembly factor CtaG
MNETKKERVRKEIHTHTHTHIAMCLYCTGLVFLGVLQIVPQGTYVTNDGGFQMISLALLNNVRRLYFVVVVVVVVGISPTACQWSL